MRCGDHLGSRKTAALHDRIEIELGQQRQEQEQSACMRRECLVVDQHELAYICDVVGCWSRTIWTLVVGATGQSREAFVSKDLLDRGGAEAILARSLELVADVVHGHVLLA